MANPPGLTYSALDIIKAALRLIQVIDPLETPDSATAQDGLFALNQMVDSWNAQRLAIFTTARQLFNLNAGQQTYLMGQSGTTDFNVPRPAKIEYMSVINLNNPVQPLELPLDYITEGQWREIPVKNIASALPQQVWDDQGFPNRTLNYWPVPNVPLQTAIYTWTALTQFQDLTTLYTFPPAYAKALRYNLAIDLAAEFTSGNINPLVEQQAIASFAVVQSMNAPLLDLKTDPALWTTEHSLYNWITDMPVRR